MACLVVVNNTSESYNALEIDLRLTAATHCTFRMLSIIDVDGAWPKSPTGTHRGVTHRETIGAHTVLNQITGHRRFHSCWVHPANDGSSPLTV